MEGARPIRHPADAELTFLMRPPYRAQAPGERRVKPSPDLLEQFLCLTEGSDDEIYRFASRFGALLVFCVRQKSESVDQIVIAEYCNVWRYLAGSMRSLLRIGARFYARESTDSQDWDVIGDYPAAVARVENEEEPEIDPLRPMLLSGEFGWQAAAYFSRGKRNRNRKQWLRLLNSILDLGRVRPWVEWNEGPTPTRPQLIYSGPNLLSYLALQLCLRASRLDSFVLCSFCNGEYSPPVRAPKIGQRNFCPTCRAQGIPSRIAQRDRRTRQRGGKN